MSTCTDIQAHKSGDESTLPRFIYLYNIWTIVGNKNWKAYEGFTLTNQDFTVHVTDLTRFHCSQVDWSIGCDIGEPTFRPPPSGAVSLDAEKRAGMKHAVIIS